LPIDQQQHSGFSGKGQKAYSEEYRNDSHLFEQFAKTELGRIDRINFQWEKSFSDFLKHSVPADSLPVFARYS